MEHVIASSKSYLVLFCEIFYTDGTRYLRRLQESAIRESHLWSVSIDDAKFGFTTIWVRIEITIWSTHRTSQFSTVVCDHQQLLLLILLLLLNMDASHSSLYLNDSDDDPRYDKDDEHRDDDGNSHSR